MSVKCAGSLSQLFFLSLVHRVSARLQSSHMADHTVASIIYSTAREK